MAKWINRACVCRAGNRRMGEPPDVPSPENPADGNDWGESDEASGTVKNAGGICSSRGHPARKTVLGKIQNRVPCTNAQRGVAVKSDMVALPCESNLCFEIESSDPIYPDRIAHEHHQGVLGCRHT